MILDLNTDVVALTEAVVDIESVSRNEKALADAIAGALSGIEHLEVTRIGNSLVARTDLGRDERVVIAGHIDTVPLNRNLPVRNDGNKLHGLGTCDMKGGVAVALRLAQTVPEPNRDVTFVFYECEEIDDVHNGLGKIASERPDLVEADFAILMEPSDAVVEAGCQGTLRIDVRTSGQRAHSARSWRGINAIHEAGEVLRRLGEYDARRPVIDGLEYHEGLNAVNISGGVASNVLPDECIVTVNYRYAPDRSEAEALVFVKEFFDGFEIEVTDSAPGALPGLETRRGECVRRGRRRHGQPEVRLDRRGPVHRPRRTRGQLRAGRPDARAQAGRVRADRPAARMRGHAVHVARGRSPR